jgi:hypothetical protein
MKLSLATKPKVLARQPLGQVVDSVISGLFALEARVGRPAWLATLTGAHQSGEAQGERLREVLDRDRALVSAGPPVEALKPTATAATAAVSRAVDEEPIRTRTMARLLAAQGHRARALAIYDALLTTESDASLRAEAELLRAQP